MRIKTIVATTTEELDKEVNKFLTDHIWDTLMYDSLLVSVNTVLHKVTIEYDEKEGAL